MALIASCSGLEIAANSVLRNEAGWSGSVLSERKPFHEKLRAALRWIGLADGPFQGLSHLENKARQLNQCDAPQILSQFRNSVVHATKKIDYTGIELHEAWTLSQWLCEMVLFQQLGYSGEYSDRRIQGRWIGETKPIPNWRCSTNKGGDSQ